MNIIEINGFGVLFCANKVYNYPYMIIRATKGELKDDFPNFISEGRQIHNARVHLYSETPYGRFFPLRGRKAADGTYDFWDNDSFDDAGIDLEDISVEGCFEHRLFTEGLYQEVELPLLAVASTNERGSFVRLNLHPAETGHCSLSRDIFGAYEHKPLKGKFYFADNSCKNKIHDGFVVVEKITHETDTYGFFVGHNVTFSVSAPSEDSVADWLGEKNIAPETLVRFVSNPSLGTAVIIGCGFGRLLRQDADGCLCEDSHFGKYFFDQMPYATTVDRDVSVGDFVCQNYRGRHNMESWKS